MNLHMFLLLFVCMLSLTQLGHWFWHHHGPPYSEAGNIRSTVHRLLKPRSPLDCPTCRTVSTFPASVRPAPLPVRPWREVKSRRGAPKRIDTHGFAYPNQQCPYFGITDAQIHAASRRWQAWLC